MWLDATQLKQHHPSRQQEVAGKAARRVSLSFSSTLADRPMESAMAPEGRIRRYQASSLVVLIPRDGFPLALHAHVHVHVLRAHWRWADGTTDNHYITYVAT